MTPEETIFGILRCLIGAKERKAAIESCHCGYGETRNLAGIFDVARSCGANRRITAALLGFLPSANEPKEFVDALDQREEIMDLPRKLEPAFAVFRYLHPGIEAALAYDIVPGEVTKAGS